MPRLLCIDFSIALVSVVVSGLVESDRVIRVNSEVRRVDVVALEDHLHDLRLMNGALLHEADDLVLMSDSVVNVVIELHLHLILELTGLVHELLVFGHGSEILTVLSEKTELRDMSPRVVSIAHGVHGPNAHVLATSEQVHLVDLAIEVLPVRGERNPREAIDGVEDGQGDLPLEEERVDEEEVPTERDRHHLRAVGVLEVDLTVLNVIARPEKHLTLTVEFERLRRLVDFIGALKILDGTGVLLLLSSIHDLVQVVHLSEVSHLGGTEHHRGTLLVFHDVGQCAGDGPTTRH